MSEVVGFGTPSPLRGESVVGGKALGLRGENDPYNKTEERSRLLFGVVRTTEGFKVTVSLVLDGTIVDTKYGSDQLKHHALAILENLATQYVIDAYNEPAKFFDTVIVR